MRRVSLGVGEARTSTLRRRAPISKKSERKAQLEQLDKLLRRIVLLRDGFTCRKCGATPSARSVGQAGVVLQAAHIYGKGAHPAMRYQLDNVLCLCKRCHFWWHRSGFGREAAKENYVRRWCIEAIGQPLMDKLDLIARTRKGKSGQSLDLIRIYLQQEIDRWMVGGVTTMDL